MNKDIAEVLDYLRKNDGYVITGHVRPDGDSCAASVAFLLLLKAMGKKGAIFEPEAFPPEYRFLLDWIDPGGIPADPVVAALDCGDKERMAYVPPRETNIVNIDHHASNDSYGTANLVRSGASSACEVIYDLYRESGVEPEKRFFEALYTGIMTDTGQFSFSNVKPATFRAAGDIIEKTGDLSWIPAAVYSSQEAGKVRLTGAVMERMRLYCGGRLAVSHISMDDMKKYGVDESRFDGIIDRLRDVEGIEVYILMKEKNEGQVRLSLRSKGSVAVDRFADTLESGGGHSFAAGATASGTLDEVEKMIKNYWEKIL